MTPPVSPQSFADTLRLLTGGGRIDIRPPRTQAESLFLGSSPAGLPSDDLLLLTSGAGKDFNYGGQTYSPDWILSHEFGHRLHQLVRNMRFSPKEWTPTPLQQETLRLFEDMVSASDRPGTDPIARGNSQNFAQAFASAVEYLRNVGPEAGTTTGRKFLGRRERSIPGTARMVRFLRQTPLFHKPPPPQGAETTELTPQQERAFQRWARANGIRDARDPRAFYDYRGYWLSVGGAPHRPGEHFPDTFKQHGHPTFSVESKYSRGPYDGGSWDGETFIPATDAFLRDLLQGVPRQ